MSAGVTERSLVRWALHVGLGASALPLLGLGTVGVVKALTTGDARRPLIAVPQGMVIVGLGAFILAAGEEVAARRLRDGRTPSGLLVFAAAALLATTAVAGNLAWVTALGAGGPTGTAQGALDLLRGLEGRLHELLLAALLPIGIAATRAARWRHLALRLGLCTATVGGFVAGAVALGEMRAVLVGIPAVLGAIAYLLGALVADKRLPEGPPHPPPLLVALAVPIVGVWLVVVIWQASWVGFGILLLLLFGLFEAAWRTKRLLTAAFDAWGGAPDRPIPPDFDHAGLASLGPHLARHNLRVVTLRQPSAAPLVQAIAEGATPCVAFVQLDRRAEGVWEVTSTNLVTHFPDERSVVTTSATCNGLHWLLRSPGTVQDHRPGATLEELVERHAADVSALTAQVGPPTGPGSAARFLESEVAALPSLRARLRAVPAVVLLAALHWFQEPRPVRFRGPLPT